jgi:hypothetical protein
MIKFQCDKCGWQLDLPDKYAGRRVRCKGCNQISVVVGSQTGANGSTSCGDDTPQEFMKQHYHVFQALLRHEKEAPPIEDTDLR